MRKFFKQTSPENERKLLEEILAQEAPKHVLNDLITRGKQNSLNNTQELSKAQNALGAKILTDYINDKTNIGYTTYAHVGDDVQIFADGDHQNQFNGHMENIEIAKRVFKVVGGR